MVTCQMMDNGRGPKEDQGRDTRTASLVQHGRVLRYQDHNRMNSRDLAVGIFFLSQTALGMLGNLALLCCFVIVDFSGVRVKPTDLIVKHLTWANFIVLFKGIPQTIAAFSQTYYVDDVSCKLVLYFHRVARGVSLVSTSLLSVFQAITISPSNSMWAQLKIRALDIIGPSLGLCWALQLLVYAFFPVYTTDIKGGRNVTGIKIFEYCAVVNLQRPINTLTLIVLTSNDVMFLGLMMWASGYMVFILLKHKQRIQHIHRCLSPRSSPETKATQGILTLVSSFVLFYVMSIVFTAYLSVLEGTSKWVSNAGAAMAACFPAFCPFLLLRHYSLIFRLCSPSSYQTTL
ncbi:vomeronasal type-1 receptor 4-like [Peromyscus californicus insignis]|uniref:vomeronasal type-1 receptor 4-like n=1 Tax=Peromyscus californicus insignis TaxID=564181 RepID=UPI0022A6F70B|nr:vomeronasal type-1 receptor 4-like [Peromyscus californicus insignis]